MNALLFLLAATSSAALPQAAAVERAPMPAAVPDAKQIATWVADLADSGSERQQIAIDGLKRAGARAKAAVPDLIEMLTADPPRVPWYIGIEIFGAIGPDAKAAVPYLTAEFKPDFNGGYNDRIAVAIANIDGPKPVSTLALLMSSTKVNPVGLSGSQYFKEYPKQVVPHLVDLCGHKDATVREKAAIVLGGGGRFGGRAPGQTSPIELAGEGGKGVPAALEKLLTDENMIVRMTAAQAIAQVAPQLAEKSIPVVIAAMKDAKTSTQVSHLATAELFRPVPDQAAKALIALFDEPGPVRSWAIFTVSSMPVKEQLETALKHGKAATTREAAALCLGTRHSGVPESLPALTAALADPEFIVRFAAAKGLTQVGLRGSDAHKAAIPALVEGLKQENEQTRLAAGMWLVYTRETAKVAVPELKQLLADKNQSVALEAALALIVIEPKSAHEAIAALTNALSGTDAEATRAARALAPMGVAAKAAVPELVKKFEDTVAPALRVAAAEAAARIDPAQSEKAVALLLGLLNVVEEKKEAKQRGSLRSEATKSLGRLGSNARPAMQTLLKVFETEKPSRYDIRNELAIAMILIDADNAKPALTMIREHLSGKSGYNYELDDMIKELGPASKPLMRELLEALKSMVPGQRYRAIELLGDIGPDAKDALPLLKEIAVKETRQQHREAAMEAVKKIEGK